MLILKIALAFPLRKLFDYLPPDDCPGLRPGLRIRVPFGNKQVIGYLIETSDQSEFDRSRLKKALQIIDETPLLSDCDVEILNFASRYYHHPIGEVFAAAFPVLLRQGKTAKPIISRYLCLTEAAQSAVAVKAPRQALLLQLIKTKPEGIEVSELSSLEWNWRGPAKALIDKGLACFKEGLPVLPKPADKNTGLVLNPAQQAAVSAVESCLGRYQAFLLEGVTGSGKTEVYMQLIATVLARDEQVMILLPEINLTPQLARIFHQRFSCALAVFHSGLNETERCRAWLDFRCGDAKILLGTRSAAFTPMAKPGLIILDEEHDASFKQQEGFRFSARDIAVMRARRLNIPILMGSATPSLESLFNVQKKRYQLLELPKRAGSATAPSFRMIDIRNQALQDGLSNALIAQMNDALKRGEQVLLFINRRGFAPALICHACGWVAGCRHCDANLVIHQSIKKLRCHHCGHESHLIDECPQCKTRDLRALGLGIERVEQALTKIFAHTRIVRIDRDSTRKKGSLDEILHEIHAGKAEILLGTQMLAKGHHFPFVTLVGILDVDAGLYCTDFRASERTAQLITQVAGRAGREQKPGLVLLQTRHPDHPLLTRLIREGYKKFAESALDERRLCELPPFSHQALWRAEANDAEKSTQFLSQVKDLALQLNLKGLSVLGPVPAPLQRKAGMHRCQLLMQSAHRKHLHELIDQILPRVEQSKASKQVRWSIDIDPADLY